MMQADLEGHSMIREEIAFPEGADAILEYRLVDSCVW